MLCSKNWLILQKTSYLHCPNPIDRTKDSVVERLILCRYSF
uniref:Uncharacterized protein MANES_18G084600 n=1 Tax=Rhizophora mucronata TaxID=61149 RepID=A0A2P2JIQ9_RHIMU